MPRTTVDLRGQRVEVEFRDHGYEPDTNAHDIDWKIVDEIADDPNFELTEKEEESIYLQLAT